MGSLCEAESKRPSESSLVVKQTPVQPPAVLEVKPMPVAVKKICKQDFQNLGLVGKVILSSKEGAFGKVYKVMKKSDQQIYAMKEISKKTITDHNLEANNFLERDVMRQSFSPFVVTLKYAFQSTKNCYFIMDYVQGGELYKILQQTKGLPEHVVKFLAAEIVLALEYLHHEINVLYRDLKPENVLLTEKGHVKLTDFGLATYIKEESNYTMAGTPEYLAPEIITRAGHSYEVDLWTLGVLIYEMLDGNAPFTHPERNVHIIQQLILTCKPVYTSRISQDARSLIQGLLQFSPKQRIGAKSFDELKAHPFFKGLDFKAIAECTVKSPLETFALQNAAIIDTKLKPIQEREAQSIPQQTDKIPGFTYDPSKEFPDNL